MTGDAADPRSAPAIEVLRLVRKFGATTAVAEASFRVERGAIFGLLGPNGAGKSTIIRMLCGVLRPSAGTARVLGHDVVAAPEAVKRSIGYMSQHFALYPDLTALENLRFAGRVYGIHGSRLDARIEELIELLGLDDDRHRRAEHLSGGWKQRLALGCALVHDPALLFLDEPTAGIDPVARRELWDFLSTLAGQGKTLFVTTHSMDEAERCSTIGYLQGGRILALGTPDELRSLESVTPDGTHRLEIDGPEVAAALERVRAVEGVYEATLYGRAVHALVEDGVEGDALLASAGLEDGQTEARPIDASLEDVFVMLARGAETGDEGAARGSPITGEDATAAEFHARDAAPPPSRASAGAAFAGLGAVLRKEFTHVMRDRAALFFIFLIPLIQTILFGYALDTQVEHIPMVVLDHDGTRDSEELVESFVATRTFDLVGRFTSFEEFRRAITSGSAQVGLRIPAGFSADLLRGEPGTAQVLIDGSDAQVATTAQRTVGLLGFSESLQRGRLSAERSGVNVARDATGVFTLPVDIRSRILFNPDLESAHFFVPALVGIILQLVTLFLTAFAIVREREMGTLEQLFVTPVGRAGLLVGKLVPYAVIGFLETLLVLAVMTWLFGVPIRGDIASLLVLSALFLVCGLSLGLLVSTLAKTQAQAMQLAFLVMMPSILLSGFIFPRDNMPTPIYLISHAIPVTYYIEILRGVILRAADLRDLAPQVRGLVSCCAVILLLALLRFRKELD